MLYHASNISGIRTLLPSSSGHANPLVYFSSKKENTLVYLSNPVERYCKSIGYEHTGRYYRFMSYRFAKNNLLEILEYWPNALEETYKGVSGSIYTVSHVPNLQTIDLPYVFASAVPVEPDSFELIPDAYHAILEAESAMQIKIVRHNELNEETLEQIKNLVCREYKKAQALPEYKLFLETKFPNILS